MQMISKIASSDESTALSSSGLVDFGCCNSQRHSVRRDGFSFRHAVQDCLLFSFLFSTVFR